MASSLDRTTRPLAFVDEIEERPGPFTFAVDEQGGLLRLQFLDGDYPERIEQAMERLGYRPSRNPGRTAEARAQLLAYCRGERRDFALPVRLRGTAWQRAVWAEVSAIPFGETRTYGELADALGRPRAARAVGRANATNPVCVVVPCHRVVGADGGLTGYEGGILLKARLLEHEARVRRTGWAGEAAATTASDPAAGGASPALS